MKPPSASKTRLSQASTPVNGGGRTGWRSEGPTEARGAYKAGGPGLEAVLAPDINQGVNWGLPAGHRFFQDCLRESSARFIEWALRQAKGDSWFMTLTFVNEVNPGKARHMSERYLARLNQGLRDTGGQRLRWARASEWQERKVIHFHILALGWGLSCLSRKRWEARWKAEGGGWCRVYNADLKAAPYLAKYLNKQPGGELSWGGAWRGMVAPASVSCCGPKAQATSDSRA